jgi:hypothetical protein
VVIYQELLAGMLDDISGNTAPVYSTDPDGFQDSSSQAIGRQDTALGALAVLFTITADVGSDGPGTRTDVLKLVLSGTNVTNLYATQTGAAALVGLVGEDLQISLFAVSDTVIEGRIAGDNGNGSDAYVAFRISLVDADDPTTARLVVEQFMAIDHGVDDPSLPDEAASLLQRGNVKPGGGAGTGLPVPAIGAGTDSQFVAGGCVDPIVEEDFHAREPPKFTVPGPGMGVGAASCFVVVVG